MDGRVADYTSGSGILPHHARYVQSLDQEKWWCILDAVAKTETPVDRMLIVTSPKQGDCKGIKFGTYEIRHVPPWTLPEVQAWHALTGSKNLD